MQYQYVAYNLQQGVIKGRIEARSAEEARTGVVNRGFKPLRLRKAWQPPTMEQLFPSFYKIKTADLIRFTRHLSTMVSSGASLQRTLQLLQAESRNKVMKRVIGEITRSVDEGGTISSAMAEHPKEFDPLFISIVQVGEFTGRLSPALEQLADMMERSQEAMARAFKTLMMPMFNMAVAFLMMVMMFTVVLPPVFASFPDNKPPLMMRLVVGTIDFAKHNPIHVVVGLAVVIGGFVLLRKIPAVSLWMDGAKARIPMIGPLVVSGELSRFSRTMGMLVESGVSLADALQLGIKGAKNQAMKRAFTDAEESLVSGKGMTEALRRHPVLPAMWVELVNIGEESNTLGPTMRDLGNVYQKQAQGQIDTMVAVLDPISQLAVGGVVLVIFMSTIQPVMAQMQTLAPP